MKKKLLFSLLIVISCGRVDVKVGDSVGDFKNVSPLSLGSQEVELIKSICDGIAQKTSTLPMLINSNLNFSYSMRGCEDSSFNTPVDVSATLQNIFGNYKIVKNDGATFYFSDPETTETGTMSVVCKQLAESGRIQSPINLEQEFVFISTVGISSENCAVSTNEACVEISRGTLDASGMAKIHTKEWIRFSLDNSKARKGFFTSKKQISSISCAEGKLMGHKAILK